MSRELDAEVAERVFGYAAKHIETDEQWHKWNGDDWFQGAPDLLAEIEEERGIGGYSEYSLPPYSSSIAAAWLVVEHFRAYELKTSDRNVKRIMCRLWGQGIRARSGYAEDDTAPLAICRAALLACAAASSAGEGA